MDTLNFEAGGELFWHVCVRGGLSSYSLAGKGVLDWSSWSVRGQVKALRSQECICSWQVHRGSESADRGECVSWATVFRPPLSTVPRSELGEKLAPWKVSSPPSHPITLSTDLTHALKVWELHNKAWDLYLLEGKTLAQSVAKTKLTYFFFFSWGQERMSETFPFTPTEYNTVPGIW